ncbi:helix-turn-helix domain-containing protein [Streptomyces albus subsp. chlorinus]|uniref:helix-turn-helix domain-containing protein n=1 Tax=Streptomyces albus TaxID=1888 RepID=UPI00156ED14E|nr:helix-turn-helix transcriptional regulator [Streptomyces albus]NSC24667.1 helix-turn-helix domain-containing protein [Streptomyces albus subsp. chlorinus]
MAAENDIGDLRADPRVSTLAYFGTELRLVREEAGLSQSGLGRHTFYAPSYISRVESANRVPSKKFAQRCDTALVTGGRFERLWPLVIEHAYPEWFTSFVHLEEEATEVWNYQNCVVPGLLQTEEYARAMFLGGPLPDFQKHVTARLSRQQVLERKSPPHYWAGLNEAVLHRPLGGRDVMRRQLEHLLACADNPNVIIQVLPFDAGAPAGLSGDFCGLRLDTGPEAVYEDGIVRGTVLFEPDDVRFARRAYDLLMAHALSPNASLDMIAARAKELVS